MLLSEPQPTSEVIDGKVYEQLFAFVKRRVASPCDAEDLVQQVMLKVITSPHPSEELWAPWLFRVARNAVIDAMRRSKRLTNVQLDESTQSHPAAEESPFGGVCEGSGGSGRVDGGAEVERVEDTDAIARYLVTLIESLDASDREALRFVDLQNHSQRDFAEEHQLGYPTAKSRVQRARKRLRQSLEAHCTVELDARGVPVACTPRKAGCCS